MHFHTNKQVAFTLAATLVLLLSGCQSYTQSSADFNTAWKTGQLGTAVNEISQKNTSAKDGKDSLVVTLEQASVLRTAALANLQPPATPPGKPGAPATAMGTEVPPSVSPEINFTLQSNAAFEDAYAKVCAFEEQAKTKVSNQASAVMLNLAAAPYRGTGYDKIMLHTYSAANYLKLGKPDNARVAFNRLLQCQKDVVTENTRRIAEAQEAAQKAKEGKLSTDGKEDVTANQKAGEKDKKTDDKSYDVGTTMKEPALTKAVSTMDADLNARMQGYTNYVNPFSVFLDGLYFATYAEGGSDMERARKSFERVAAMHPDNAYLKEDLALAESLVEGKKIDGTTYVIFETGSAPSREEWKLDIPMFVFNQRLPNVVVALPKLKFDDAYTHSLSVAANGKTYQSALVCNMDAVVAQDFKNEWPSTLTKSLISTAFKAGVDAAAAKYNKDQGSTTSLLLSLAVKVTNYATTIADTRSWTTLPKQFQYCRLATPEDHTLVVTADGPAQTITLSPGRVNLVWVKNVAPGLPIYVSQTVLQ